MQLPFKTPFGQANVNVDPQRSDLFQVVLVFPPILNVGANAPGTASLWESECQFAVKTFPFPERDREMIPVKYLNQTNFVIGADAPSGPVAVEVRYPFQRRTGEMLERWHQLISNSQTGGVAITSQVKSYGYFYWMVPNMDIQADPENTSTTDTMLYGPSYYIEGVLIKNLKPSNADTSVGNNLVEFTFTLQIDRYYPLSPTDLTYSP